MSASVSGRVAAGGQPAITSTAVVFDADETLLDLRPAVTGALKAR